MSELIDKLKNIIQDGVIMENELLCNHTTLKIGGPARYFVLVNNERELADLLNFLYTEKIKYFLLGNGSNILADSNGYDGVIIKLDGCFNDCKIQEDKGTIEAGAAMLLSVVSRQAYNHSLTGMEFASGIPGSIGGAVFMNAGAYGGEMKNIITSVSVLERQDDRYQVKIYSKDEMNFGYRHSIAKEKEMIVLSCNISLEKGDKNAIKEIMDQLNSQRREKQPLEFPSAGSTFKRPEGYFAGKLISDAGLKGYNVGGAEVSEKHAGFCINKGGATSQDFEKLMSDVSRIVKEKYDVVLEPEVIVLR